MKPSESPLSNGAVPFAHPVAAPATEKPEAEPEQTDRSAVSAYLAEIGRKGGLKGGKARAAKLSARTRRRIAAKAAKSRWSSLPKYHP
jgi:hypothetical protein